MDLALFILVTAILFIRPTDFVPGLEVNLYLIAIIPCILLSWPKLVSQLTTSGLRERPVFVFGIGVVLVSIVSNLVYRRFQTAYDFATEFVKILIFYLLILAHLDSHRRLRTFVGWLVGIILIPIVLSMLNYYHYVDIPAFNAMKDSAAEPGTSLMRSRAPRRMPERSSPSAVAT